MSTVFLELSEKLNAVTREQITVIEQFIGFMYNGRCINSIDSENIGDFGYSVHENLWLILPSGSGLKEHRRRAAYYSDWVNCKLQIQCVESVCLLSPSDWGWRFSN